MWKPPIDRVWRISRILARGTRSSGSLLLPPPFAFYNGYDLYACLEFRDSALQIKMYYHFEGVFEIDESHHSISICPRPLWEAGRTPLPNFLGVPPGPGGTPIYGLYRYVRPQRVWFFSRFGHK